MTALIVDDEKNITDGLSRLFDWKGCGIDRVITASGGQEALRLVGLCCPAIVVADVNMEDMSGLELMEWTREIAPLTRFIVISGYDEFTYCQKAMALKAVDYLLKPIDFQKLAESVRKCLADLEKEELLARLFSAPGSPYRGNRRDLVDALHRFLVENCHTPISIRAVAERFCLNPRYFCQFFKRETGKQFHGYLVELRMVRARHLLAEQRYSVAEISALVGYPDPKYFSQVFRRTQGMTPSEYRQRHAAS